MNDNGLPRLALSAGDLAYLGYALLINRGDAGAAGALLTPPQEFVTRSPQSALRPGVGARHRVIKDRGHPAIGRRQ